MSGDVTAGVPETIDDHHLDVVHSENLTGGLFIEPSTEAVQSPIEASAVAPAISSNSSTVESYSRGSDITAQPKNSNISLQPQSTFWLPSCTKNSNFCRNAQWCADGGSILSVLEDASIEVIDVTEDMASESRLSIKHAAPVLSTVWYPSATPTQPASYCFVAAVRDGPVKLLDASDGRLRASYKIIDHRERFIAPHSMAFNMHMNKLYCGFEDAIEVFDVHHPGGESTRLHTVPTKKSRDGLRGIVSALAFAPDWSGLYAAGSYSGAIAMYTEDTGAQAQGWLEGVEGGVTQIRFNPTQPNLVHAAFRRTPTIATWDLRKPVEPISLYDRGVVETNQRLHFDVSPDGQWLIAGDERGVISLFDTQSSGNLDNAAPRVKLEAHKDSIGAVSFHPTKPVVLSVCGSRHFEELDSDSDSSIEDSSDMEHVEIMVSGTWQSTQRGVAKIGSQPPITMDNSMKLWSYEST